VQVILSYLLLTVLFPPPTNKEVCIPRTHVPSECQTLSHIWVPLCFCSCVPFDSFLLFLSLLSFVLLFAASRAFVLDRGSVLLTQDFFFSLLPVTMRHHHRSVNFPKRILGILPLPGAKEALRPVLLLLVSLYVSTLPFPFFRLGMSMAARFLSRGYLSILALFRPHVPLCVPCLNRSTYRVCPVTFHAAVLAWNMVRNVSCASQLTSRSLNSFFLYRSPFVPSLSFFFFIPLCFF